MASYESLTFYCSSHEEEEEYDENDTDEGHDGNQAKNLSGDDDESGLLSMYLPNLSIQREEGEEEEFGHGKEAIDDDSEAEVGGYYSFKYYGSDNERRKKSGGKVRKKGKEEEEEEEEIGKGLMVITRPKGGRRSLCMDMCEVKACHELGFDLEHQQMLQIPSLSTSTLDSPTSGTDSPISNWRISSPGDDPRDVKARLKLWAQAVAVASASKHPS